MYVVTTTRSVVVGMSDKVVAIELGVSLVGFLDTT